MMKKLLPLIILVIISLVSCRKDNSSVPKRYAYPRIELYDTTRMTVDIAGVNFEINANTVCTGPRPEWLDINYPRYGVTLHIAVNAFDTETDFMEALANRQKRLELNFGDTKARTESFTNPDSFICNITGDPGAGSAPVFFTASHKNSLLLSGAVVFSGNTTPVDSIFPIYNAVYDDVVNLLLSLR